MSVRARIGAIAGTVAFIAFVSAGSASASTMPDPATIAGDLVNNAGGQYLNGVVDILPLLIPFLLGLWALGFIWLKVRPKRTGGV
jgi:hypothetical protein